MIRHARRPARARATATTATALLLLGLFLAGAARAEDVPAQDGFGTYTPNAGFKVARTDKGELNFRLYTYVRYINQKGLDPTFVDSFGDTTTLDRRQDIQLQKVNIQFNGWLMDPRFRYLAYVWTSNTSQGLGAQVVVAGNLKYQFSPHLTLGGGVDALPGVRATEGNFPFWLTVDNRLIADEFFRPSYTQGIWAEGEIVEALRYKAMVGNNLSQLGVDAGQLDEDLKTYSFMLRWYPTTGEYGMGGGFGDFDAHTQAATRVGVRFTSSEEDRQSAPNTDAFENVQIRLSDGNPIFKPDLFGPGVSITDATYNMLSADAGVKYRGFSLEGEYYWRRIDSILGPGTETLPFDELEDNGFQLQASAMVRPEVLQVYATGSKVFGEYGDPWDLRLGANWFPWRNHVVRWNLEYLRTDRSPVGGASLPYAVGGTGDILYTSFQVNF